MHDPKLVRVTDRLEALEAKARRVHVSPSTTRVAAARLPLEPPWPQIARGRTVLRRLLENGSVENRREGVAVVGVRVDHDERDRDAGLRGLELHPNADRDVRKAFGRQVARCGELAVFPDLDVRELKVEHDAVRDREALAPKSTWGSA